MAYKQELESELAGLIDSYDKTFREMKNTQNKLKSLRREQRELRKEIIVKLKQYRKFI